ncbi:hypothetical protein [Halobacillus sp. Marseille-Q1614]|uniref:hypothetical protein n=1 Tax=Halobacillus sp. Marseille-Q1614 TaxID=2709134 RepID=UPI00156D5CDB|nr:hypothetical protein [Halobacillus sp. Marseille-Q1614]
MSEVKYIELVRWSYSGIKKVRGYFSKFPHSVIYFRRMRNYYLVYTLDWDARDPVLTEADREDMQILINEELGHISAYNKRKSRRI